MQWTLTLWFLDRDADALGKAAFVVFHLKPPCVHDGKDGGQWKAKEQYEIPHFQFLSGSVRGGLARGSAELRTHRP